MKKALCLATILGTASCASQQGPPIARLAHIGLVDCYAPGVVDAKGRPLSCETSAAELIQNRVLIASDKETPSAAPSQVMWLSPEGPWPDVIMESQVQHETNSLLRSVRKIEAFAKAPEGDIVFATTDFDWPADENSTEPDAYNTIVYWPIGNLSKAAVAHPTTNEGVTSSISLRPHFSQALKSSRYPAGPPYFKIEGLTALPNRTLLFGVREVGPDYEHPTYTLTILRTRYTVSESGSVELVFPMSVLLDVDLVAKLPQGVRAGLSSIAGDSDRLWFLTSVEAPEGQLGNESFLWTSVVKDGAVGEPVSVSGLDGKSFRIPCKGEGLTILQDSSLFVVCDEDRSPTTVPRTGGGEVARRPGQGVFAIVTLK